MQITAIVPSAITSLRVAALPFLLFFLYEGNSNFFLALFLFAAGTDILDGYTARKFTTTSRAGAHYDALADFSLIAGVFAIFTITGVYPPWILGIVLVSFALFIATSLSRTRIYDPVGKYWGGLLYVVIAMTVAIRAEAFLAMAQLVIAGFFAASLASRIAWLLRETA